MKRTFDLIVVLVAAPIWIPVAAFVAFIVMLGIGRPVLFRQKRPGLHGRPFEMLKFRTMCDKRDQKGNLLPDENRLTPFGKWLRSTSLDELPELWNVLKGDMSLVGPRPLLMQYLPLYSPRQARRHEVRPGLTGWSQVNGRNELAWEEKLEMDAWYAENRTFWLDLKILMRTFAAVIFARGVTACASVTVPTFAGSQSDLQISQTNFQQDSHSEMRVKNNCLFK